MTQRCPKSISLLLPLVAAVMTSGLNVPGARSSERDMVNVTLHGTNRNSGHSGKAILMPEGDGTYVRIEVSGSSVPLVAPVRLYTLIYEGHCDSLSAQPAYSLTERVKVESVNPVAIGAVSGPYSLVNTAPVPLATLRNGSYAIVIKSSPADGNVELFCGEVPAGP